MTGRVSTSPSLTGINSEDVVKQKPKVLVIVVVVITIIFGIIYNTILALIMRA